MSQLAEFQKIFPDLTWDYTPDSLKEQTQKHIQSFKNFIDRLFLLQGDKINFENVLKPFSYHQRLFQRKRIIVSLLQGVCPCKKIRDAAKECYKLLSDFNAGLRNHKDLYDILCKVREIENNLSPEYEFYLNKHLLYRQRNGINLPKYKRDKLTEISRKIDEYIEEIKINNAEYDLRQKSCHSKINDKKKDSKVFRKESGDSLSLSINYHQARQFSKEYKVISACQNADKILFGCIEYRNVHLMEEMIKLRHEKSQILGYQTYLDYRIENFMSKNSQNVREFLKSMILKLRASTKLEMKRILKLRKKICKKNNAYYDEKINIDELNFYYSMVEEKYFSIDHKIIQEYFPFDHVKQKIMEIFQTLLHLKFTKIDNSQSWHPDVSLYSVCDRDDSRLLGYFYLDLFKRKGKYPHACCFTIEHACETEIGRQVACVAMVTNFTKSTSTMSSLLLHDEVRTFFHEFGHVMHRICSTMGPIFIPKTWVESEFTEVPSQMFEYWAWEKECLKKISCHYQKNKCLSDKLINKLIKSRKSNIAIHYSCNLFECMFDHIIHTSHQVYKSNSMDILGVEATFGLLTKITESKRGQLYQYIWSQVFSHDMFISRFKKEGIFNPSTGLSFRKCILEPGLTQDPYDLFKKFLGRDPDQKLFLKHVGIL